MDMIAKLGFMPTIFIKSHAEHGRISGNVT
jgi:hypothetical protein